MTIAITHDLLAPPMTSTSSKWRPDALIAAFSQRDMAAVIALAVLPMLPCIFTVQELHDFMEVKFGLNAQDLPLTSQGKPGLRPKWKKRVSNALAILLKEGVLEMVCTRKYRKVNP